MPAWKFVKVAPMRVTASAVRAYGDYVARRGPDRDLTSEPSMQVPDDDPDQDDGRAPEPLEAWVQKKVHDQQHVYTVVLNPGEGRVPVEQSLEWTRRTFERMERTHDQHLDYRFWVHDDAGKHSHVHAVLSSPKELSPEALRDFRFQAGRAWQELEPFYRREPDQDASVQASSSPELDRQPKPEQRQQLEPEQVQHTPDCSI